METIDSASLPDDIRARLLPSERVLYYASGGGCLGLVPRNDFLVTDDRVFLSMTKKAWLGARVVALSIPLEHVSSVGTETAGCLMLRSSVVRVDSQSASQRVVMNVKAAEAASAALQRVLRERRTSGPAR